MDIPGHLNPRPTRRLLTIVEAVERLCVSRAKLYGHLAAGDLKALKNGRRTLIDSDEVDAFIGRLPTATFRKPKGKTGGRR